MSKYQPLIWITDDYLFHMKYASLKDSNGRTAYTYFIDEREKGTFYLRLIAFVPYTFSSLKPKIAERYKTIEEAKKSAKEHYLKYLSNFVPTK